MGRAPSQKYLEASLDGWRVFRLRSEQITFPVIVQVKPEDSKVMAEEGSLPITGESKL